MGLTSGIIPKHFLYLTDKMMVLLRAKVATEIYVLSFEQQKGGAA